MREKYDHLTIEPKWQQFWKKNKTFRVELDVNKPKYYILIEYDEELQHYELIKYKINEKWYSIFRYGIFIRFYDTTKMINTIIITY